MLIGRLVDEVWEIADHKVMFPTTSFSGLPTDNWLQENGCYKVYNTKPYDKSTSKLVVCDPYLENNIVYIVEVASKTDDDIAQALTNQEYEVRQNRNRLLQESDWTQIPDCTVTDKTAWATYRTELRDITTQSGFPTSVVYPTRPDAEE